MNPLGIPGARETIAIRDLPDGEAWYAHRAREKARFRAASGRRSHRWVAPRAIGRSRAARLVPAG